MSTKYNDFSDVPNEAIINRLNELSDAVTNGKASVDREFTMRVPAECDRDADIVLSIAAKRIAELKAERDELRDTLEVINGIRNSIVGLQTVNWSEHIYPLVASLEDAGFSGMEYPEAKKHYGTLLERTISAETKCDDLKRQLSEAREVLANIIAISDRKHDAWDRGKKIIREQVVDCIHDKCLDNPDGECKGPK